MYPMLLDAGGAYLFEYVALIFLGLACIVEAIVLLIMKFNRAGKCFLDSFLVNLASLAAGFLLLGLVRNSRTIPEGDNRWTEMGIMFAITLVIEGFLLFLLNRTKPPRKIWTAVLVMNLVSYLLLIGVIIF